MADAPIEPTAPIEPAAPAEPAAPTPPADNTPDADDAEWDAVHDELYPDRDKGDKDEPAKPKESAEIEGADKPDNEDKKPDAEPGASDGTAEDRRRAEEAETRERERIEAARDSRLSARQAQAELDAIKSDIRSQLYPDAPEFLQDADGDPIKSVEDVMRLINPDTGETFTREEGTAWLMAAQQRFNQGKEEMDRRVNEISETTLDLKDRSDVVNSKYGELLKADENLKTRLWNMYERTLVKEGDIIVKATIPIDEFYDMYLAPRLEAQQKEDAAATEAAKVAQAEAERAAEEKRIADEKQAKEERDRKRADRSDVYGGGKDPKVEDPEADEWEEAKTAQFGKRR